MDEFQQIVDKSMMDAPIPGESLTTSPDSPRPWETAPEFVDYECPLRRVKGETKSFSCVSSPPLGLGKRMIGSR